MMRLLVLTGGAVRLVPGSFKTSYEPYISHKIQPTMTDWGSVCGVSHPCATMSDSNNLISHSDQAHKSDTVYHVDYFLYKFNYVRK